MSLSDLMLATSAAKVKGKEFEYPGTPVVFEFRPLSLNEFSMVIEGAAELKSEDKDKAVTAMVQHIEKVLALDPIIGWKNMTVRHWQTIANIENIPGYEEKMDDPVDFESDKSRMAMLSLARVEANEQGVGEVQNAGFAFFVSNSVFTATSEASNKITEQKKT